MRSSITLSASALDYNITEFRRYIGKEKKIIAVVKANAYGHGMKEVAVAIESKIDAFAIDDIQELIELRKQTKKDIYVLGHVCKEDIDDVIACNGIIAIYGGTILEMLDRAAAKARAVVQINIKIDAFLGRQGVLLEELPSLLEQLAHLKNIKIRGIYTHFSNIEDTKDLTHSQKQFDYFKTACSLLEEYGYKTFEKHISSTAGALVYEPVESFCTHVRVGIGLYGLWPSKGLKRLFGAKFSLQPVLSWKSCIAQVKKVPANFPIGYGCTYITKKPTIIAVVPQGYSDGYDRRLSNKGEVLVGGKRCRVLGRVAMNMFVIDVSHIKNVKIDEEVVILGVQGDNCISADEIADRADTISYEIVARITSYLQRIIVE